MPELLAGASPHLDEETRAEIRADAFVLAAAGVIAMVLAFIGKLAGLVATIPVAVTGGLAIYLFGVIGMQGIALMISERVNLFDPRQLAEQRGVLPINVALAYVLCQPFPTFPLIGPRVLSEIRTSLPALDIELSPDEVRWLNLEDEQANL